MPCSGDRRPWAVAYHLPLNDEGKYHYTEPINVRLTLRNDSKEPVTLESTDLLLMCKIEVRLPDGTAVPPTLEGKRQLENEASEFSYSELAHGKSAVMTIPSLNRLYDMTLLGEYSVTVYRRVFTKQMFADPVELRSNTIKIVVHDNIQAEKAKQARHPEMNRNLAAICYLI